MTTITLSSGHGAKVQGAVGILNEVEEARRVVDALAIELEERGIEVHTYHDNTSDSQGENLEAICDWHNSIECDLAISIHFNAYEPCEQGRGVEMLYVTQHALATEMSAAVASCGLINRGAKKRTDLKFLNSTEAPALLAEICFVDSETDCRIYEERFEDIIKAMADELGGEETDLEPIPPDDASFHAIGRCSQFGGPEDTGVSDEEGLAFIYSKDDAPHLFLPDHPDWKQFGLARQLNPFIHYVAVRWDYSRTPKETLLEHTALVRSLRTGRSLTAFPADWGPHQDTGRVADLSPGLMADLGIETDDEVEVIYPFEG
jgi:N-acetylmuramoyl-L-alanine amidase